MSSLKERVVAAEDEVKVAGEDLARVKIEFDREMTLLKADFEGQIRKIKVAMHETIHLNSYLQRQLEWKQLALERSMGEGDEFNEKANLQPERTEWLSKARAGFEEAVEVLRSVQPYDMKVLRKYTHPPPLVWTVLEALLEVNGEWNTTWEEAQIVLTDNYFFHFLLPRAKKYDLDNVSDEILNDLEDNMADPDFTPAVVAKINEPCAAFCQFVRAIYEYAKIQRFTDISGESSEELAETVVKLRDSIHDEESKLTNNRRKLADVEEKFEMEKRALAEDFDARMEGRLDNFQDAHTHYCTIAASSIHAHERYG